MMASWLANENMRTALRWTVNVCLFIIVFGSSYFVVSSYMIVVTHPRTVRAIWTDTPVVKQGEMVHIVILADIHAPICRGEVHRWIINADENKPVWERIEPTQEVKVGKNALIDVHVPTADIAPGNYYYKSVVYDRRCDDLYRAYPPTSPSFVFFKVEQ